MFGWFDQKPKYLEQVRPLSVDERIHLAQDPQTAPELLEVLSKDDSWEVRDAVADQVINSNLELSSDLLNFSVRSSSVNMRRAAAQSPKLTRKMIGRLIKDADTYVVARLAENPILIARDFEKINQRLVQDSNGVPPDRIIANYLSNNQLCPPAILESLVYTSDIRVLRNLACNPGSPPGLLRMSHARLKEIAQRNPEENKGWLEEAFAGLAENPQTPADVATYLCFEVFPGLVPLNVEQLAKTHPSLNPSHLIWLFQATHNQAEDFYQQSNFSLCWIDNTGLPVENLIPLLQSGFSILEAAVLLGKR